MNHQEEPPPEPSPQYLMNSKVVFEESRNVNFDYWTAQELYWRTPPLPLLVL